MCVCVRATGRSFGFCVLLKPAQRTMGTVLTFAQVLGNLGHFFGGAWIQTPGAPFYAIWRLLTDRLVRITGGCWALQSWRRPWQRAQKARDGTWNRFRVSAPTWLLLVWIISFWLDLAVCPVVFERTSVVARGAAEPGIACLRSPRGPRRLFCVGTASE